MPFPLQRRVAGSGSAPRSRASSANHAGQARLTALQRLADQTVASRRIATLQRMADGRAAATGGHGVVQRSGDFSGMMLPHEDQPGAKSYSLGGKVHERDGVGEHKLTYHHIVPEGKLARLGAMMMRFETLFGEKNAHTDRLDWLRSELAGQEAVLWQKRKAIRLGNEAEDRIAGLKRRQDPEAATKARDRGWDRQVEEAAAAERTIKATEAAVRDIAAQIEEIEVELKASVELNGDEARLLDGQAQDVAGQGTEPVRRGTGGQTRRAVLKAQIKELVQSTRAQAEEVRAAELDRMRSSDEARVRNRADGYAAQELRETFSDEYGASLAFAGTAWIPGNIHEGPSKRISPGDGNPQFDAERDDGGSGFEESAKHVVDPAQFALLKELSINLEKFEESESIRFDAERIDKFIDLITRINEFRKTFPDMTQFDVSNWEQVKTTADRREAGGDLDPGNHQAKEFAYAGIRSP